MNIFNRQTKNILTFLIYKTYFKIEINVMAIHHIYLQKSTMLIVNSDMK